jgi:hypothetical protein
MLQLQFMSKQESIPSSGQHQLNGCTGSKPAIRAISHQLLPSLVSTNNNIIVRVKMENFTRHTLELFLLLGHVSLVAIMLAIGAFSSLILCSSRHTQRLASHLAADQRLFWRRHSSHTLQPNLAPSMNLPAVLLTICAT